VTVVKSKSCSARADGRAVNETKPLFWAEDDGLNLVYPESLTSGANDMLARTLTR
jgi:hypothetical protein